MRHRIGIIGGGPAGLSLAKLLQSYDHIEATVLEAEPGVGGKSRTAVYSGVAIEQGTCYATRAHKIVLNWMKQLKVPTRPMGKLRFEGRPFMKYVKDGDGPALPVQILRYLSESRRLRRALGRDISDPAAIREASTISLDWLRERNLGKIERMLHRTQTALGYGLLDETAIVQTLRWNDLDLVLTGVFDLARMPVEGWEPFWNVLADELRVRTDFRVEKVEREAESVSLTSTTGERLEFDQIVCAMPFDEFCATTTPSSLETAIDAAISWGGYTTTLVAADHWFTDIAIEAYAAPIVPGAPPGGLLSGRIEALDTEFGAPLYTTGQLSGPYSDEELREILIKDLEDKGAAIRNIVLQRTWKYFAQYDPAKVAEGLLEDMQRVQGKNNTWYTGTAFSHESVSNIVNFNVSLAEKIANACSNLPAKHASEG